MVSNLKNSNAAELLDDLLKEILSSPQKAPLLFLWLCHAIPEQNDLNQYANLNFLLLLLTLISKKELKAHHAALKKLFDPAGVVDFAIRKLSIDQTKQFMAQLERDPALEEYRKARIIKGIADSIPKAN